MSRSFDETSFTGPLADQDRAVADLLETGDHPERRRLAAAGRADEDHELVVLDHQLERIDRAGPVGIDLRDLLELNRSHTGLLCASDRHQPLIAPPSPAPAQERALEDQEADDRHERGDEQRGQEDAELASAPGSSAGAPRAAARSGFVSTSSGQRKSFHDARTANTETTPRIGLRHRQHDRDEQPERPGTVDPRRLEDLARQVVEEALHEHDVEGARAGRQPDRPVAVDERVVDQRRVHDLDVERHEQHDRRHEQRRQQRAPMITRAYRGRSTESANPPVVATTIWTNHEPIASTTVFQK